MLEKLVVPASLIANWQAEVARHTALPERTLDWSEALALLERNNLKLRSARVDITNAQELAYQVFRDLIRRGARDTRRRRDRAGGVIQARRLRRIESLAGRAVSGAQRPRDDDRRRRKAHAP